MPKLGQAGLLFATLLAWVIGTWAQLLQPILKDAIFYVYFLLIAGVFIAYVALKKIAKIEKIDDLYRYIFIICLLAANGFAAYGLTGLRAVDYASRALSPVYEGRDIEVVGVVAAMPQISEAGTRFQLDVESAHLLTTVEQVQSRQAVILPSKISLSWYGGVFGVEQRKNQQTAVPQLQQSTQQNPQEERDQVAMALQRAPMPILPGERWKMTVRLKAPHGNSNPGGFDFELWLWEQGIQATGYVRTGQKDAAPVRLAQTSQHPVEQLRYKVRDAIFVRMSNSNSAIDTAGHSREAGIVAALVTGDQQSIDRADWDVFRATGVAHLMSISGLHITMFAWGAVMVVGWLYRRSASLCLAYPAPHAALLGGLLLATLYAVFSGWGVPSQRTIWMLATATLLRLFGKRWPWPTVWMLACVVVVIIDPWALLQAGFWLSFVAVGVLFATDLGQAAEQENTAKNDGATPVPPLGLIANIKKKLWLSSREQFIITLVLAPLTLLLFGQVSVVGLLANALAIPWVTLVVTPLAMLGTLFSPLWDIAGMATRGLSLYLGTLATWPFATISIATPPILVSALGVVGGILMVMPWPWQLRALGLPLLLPVVLWHAPRPDVGQFELLAADIGQGNGVIIRTAEHTLVYDAGPRFSIDSDAGHRVLVPLLRSTNESVDTVMLSHRDSDHSGGIKSVLAMHPKAAFISSVESTHDLQAFRPVQRCFAGQKWQWDGVDFAVLHPSAVDYESPQKSNAMSCVLRISTPHQSALLVGDIEQAQEARLVEDHQTNANVAKNVVFQNDALNNGVLKSTVLLVPHHGSKTSSSAAFLDAVQPQLAIVQAGYRNRFGHPADAVLARYNERNIKVLDTAHCGALLWSSALPKEMRCQREFAKRYWQHAVP
jgi:competence protein ComEC